MSSPFDLPLGARPGRDQPVGQDELGRTIYRTIRGAQYTIPDPVTMPAPSFGERAGMVGEAARGATLGGIFDVAKGLGRGVVEGIVQGVTAPRRALQGEPQTYGDVAATAGLGIFGGAPFQTGQSTLRSGIGRSGDPEAGIRAFQGSPHDFPAERLVRYPDGRTEFIVGAPDALPDIPAGAELVQDFPLGRMRMDKIGTGEGAQAYGHGLYSAEAEVVARGYRDALSEAPGIRGILPEGEIFNDPSISVDRRLPTAQGVVLERLNDYFQENVSLQGLSQNAIADAIDKTEQNIRNRLVQRIRENPLDRQRQIREFGVDRTEQAYSSQLDHVGSLRNRIDELEPVPGAGRMYEVNIAAQPEQFLDWDMPLAGQTPEIQSAIRQIAPDAPGMAQGNRLLTEAYPQPGQEVAGEFLGETATRRLREAGIPGIRYMDADSRSIGQGTSNFVVFDENLISIVRKYGIAGAATMLGVTAADVQQALADNLPQSEWESLVVGE